jgi:hypothetical protein
VTFPDLRAFIDLLRRDAAIVTVDAPVDRISKSRKSIGA